MYMRDKVLAIIPAYNEEGSLQNTIEELKAVAPEVDFIVINDGSTDSTGGICRANGYPVLDLPVNGGLTVGFQTGMKYAARKGYGYAIQFDADGQHMPRYIDAMRKKMDDADADIVIGSRFKTERKPVNARMIGSQIITVAIWMTTGGHYIGDVTSGMRLFNKKMIKRFGYDMHYSPEPDTLAYLLNCNVKIREIQVEMHERIAGVSYLDFKGSIWYMMKMLFSIFLFQWVRRKVKE